MTRLEELKMEKENLLKRLEAIETEIKKEESKTTTIKKATNKKDVNSAVKNMTSEELINTLLNKDGKERADKLGIVKEHYNKKKDTAKRFYHICSMKCHPDTCSDPRAIQAFNKLQDIYFEMTM